MFQSLKDLREFSLVTLEGEAGTVEDFIFHDHDWAVRYAIVDLTDDRRYALVLPETFDRIDRKSRQVTTSMSKEMLHHSPVFHLDEPITRVIETEIHDYFQWPYYWDDEKTIPTTGPGDLTGVPLSEMEVDLEDQEEQISGSEEEYYDNLKRFDGVLGFRLQTRTGEDLGRLEDFIVQDDDWKIMYAVVTLGGLLPSKRVLVSPSQMEEINPNTGEIVVSLKAQTIASSPEYSEEMLTDENYDWSRHK